MVTFDLEEFKRTQLIEDDLDEVNNNNNETKGASRVVVLGIILKPTRVGHTVVFVQSVSVCRLLC